MGIFSNFIRGQFIDVIEWKDPSQNIMVYRYDCGGKEIMMGAQLTGKARSPFWSTKASWPTFSAPAGMSCRPRTCRS